jgi:excinuclease ABC subunit B
MSLVNQVIFVSATPGDEEISLSGDVVEQVVRPTGILDPEIEVRPSQYQIDDLIKEIHSRISKKQKVLVTTLTKRMAEELTKYLLNIGIKCNYIHSDIDALKRVEIIDDLRKDKFDVLIGINLLREGLDLPEVSLVAILDADKEGFLRSERSLTQTAGRAARNIDGKVIMYADRITESMQKTISETNRRREKQIKYNIEHNIVPQQIFKRSTSWSKELKYEELPEKTNIAADPVVEYMTKEQLMKAIKEVQRKMEESAKNLEFIEAAMYRDEMFKLQALLESKFAKNL